MRPGTPAPAPCCVLFEATDLAAGAYLCIEAGDHAEAKQMALTR